MTPKQEDFATALAAGLSQAAAYREAYPAAAKWKDATVWEEASRLAAHPEVRARLTELRAKAAAANEVSIERLARELVSLAHFDAGDLAKYTVRTQKDIAKLPEQIRRAIVGWSWDAKGRLVLKFEPKTKAIELLGRMTGAFNDKLAITGKDGGPIETKQLRDLTEDELAAEMKRHGLQR